MNAARSLITSLAQFPWGPALRTLRERVREDRLALSAGSLTFTTTIALVPFFTVVLALFTAFPVFGKLQGAVQAWLVQSLVPDAISRQVLGALTQFATKASRLGTVGMGVLVVTALSLVLTIDRTLNGIWRVRRPRPLAQRVLVYWAVITLGPLLLAASLSVTSYLVSASRGLVAAVPGGLVVVIDAVEFLMLAAGLAALYRFVPNTPVRTAHAWVGGLFSAAGIEGARALLALYIGAVPTYSAVYGAFATVPILLVWIYLLWLVILLGAVLAAYLPGLLAGPHRRAGGPGWQFQLALEAVRALDAARAAPRRGLSTTELAREMQVTDRQLEPVLEHLVALDWIGRLNEVEEAEASRYVLLADTASTALAPLMQRLLLPANEATSALWRSGRLEGLVLRDAL
ncbi:YihY family inner membrane protein [Ramlibacter sp. MAHUQ-53]|uniref:YihY family inner membrane protein n=1 Tax=unclassified Ramlibacter TaxID=2617605 RepID=UPI003631867C